MRIIILGPAYPYRGGIAAFNERLARQLIAEGHDVQLVTFTLQYPSLLFPGTTQYSTSAPPEGLAIERRLNSVNPINWYLTGRRLRKANADLLVVSYWMWFMAPAFSTVARMVRRGGRTRVVTLLHNLLPHERKPFDTALARMMLRQSDGILTLSDAVAADVARLMPGLRCVVTPHPVYDHFGDALPRAEACRRLGLDPATGYLLFFGLIRDYKGLDLLIEALADPRIRQSGFRLIVAGEFYTDGSRYHDLSASLGVDDAIVWRTGYIPDTEVSLYFSVADLVVQPYKSATQSGVTQVAYHFVRPMLVTRVGGLPELVPDGRAGYVVDPTPSGIADGLAAFVSRRPDFTEGLLAEKRKYGWDVLTSQLSALYHGIR